MSKAEHQRADELDDVRRTYETMERLIDENTELKTRAESFERQAAILTSDNESLRQQIKRAKIERDHYFRAFSVLSANLDGIASALITAINGARTQDYGGRRPVPDVEKAAKLPETIPSFLREGPRHEAPPINMKSLAETLAR